MEQVETITTILLLFIFLRLLIITFRKFKDGYFSVAMPLVAVMFVFLCLPIILDITIGKPNFIGFAGFYQAMANRPTSIYYNLYIGFVGLIFTRYIKKSKQKQFVVSTNYISTQLYNKRYLLWIVMLLPIIAVAFANNSAEYLEYKASHLDHSIQFKDSHVFVSKATLLSAMAGSFLIYYLNRGKGTSVVPKYILYVILLFITFWVDGKRGIWVKYAFNLLISGWLLGKLKPGPLLKRALIIIVVLVNMVLFYGKDFAEDVAASRDIYSSFRVNMGRDQTIKFTMYREFVVNQPILQYRGQSFLFDAFFYVPRAIWAKKPYPYAVYFVTSVLNLPPEPIGWSFTTCILEEFISNFGIIGILLAPLFLLWICKVGDKSANTVTKFFAIIVSVFFLFTQLAAFMPLFLVFLFLFLKEKFKKKKKTIPNYTASLNLT